MYYADLNLSIKVLLFGSRFLGLILTSLLRSSCLVIDFLVGSFPGVGILSIQCDPAVNY